MKSLESLVVISWPYTKGSVSLAQCRFSSHRWVMNHYTWGMCTVDVSYVAPQVHRIVNVALHREYSPGIIFIFPKGGRKSIMSKTNTGSNSNEYY
jgi:hypothetical protein